MNHLSSHPKVAVQLVILSLVVFGWGSAWMNPAVMTAAPAATTTGQDLFSQYGFSVAGFTGAQEELIRKTLAAYAEALGGRETLRKIVTGYNGGKAWTITYDPNRVGANSAIMLSPTVFSLEKARANNYHTFCTDLEEAHAEIIIGHEIGHQLVRASRARNGVNWAKSYELRVKRDWRHINNPQAPEEEAVTELSLKVLKLGYYLDLDGDKIESDPRIVAGIGGWVANFTQSLKQL